MVAACEQAVRKHVDFYSKNKFEKLVNLVGFYYKKRTKNCCNEVITSMNIHIVLWKVTFYRLIDTNIAEKCITYRNSTAMEEAVGLLHSNAGTT
jgi:transposase